MELQSFFAQLLLKLQEHIKTEVPEIRYINQDLGQLEVYDMGSPAVSWPCVLVDMSDTNYADLHQGVQEANICTVVFRLGFNPFSQTSNLQPEEVRKLGLYYYELEQKLYQALQGYNADGLCQPLTRTRMATEKREEDAFRVRVMIMTTAFEDDGASLPKITINPDLEIDFDTPL